MTNKGLFPLFQSPYGGRGRSDLREKFILSRHLYKFQSPYGGRGRSDVEKTEKGEKAYKKFQSPYGGRGRSDRCS